MGISAAILSFTWFQEHGCVGVDPVTTQKRAFLSDVNDLVRQ